VQLGIEAVARRGFDATDLVLLEGRQQVAPRQLDSLEQRGCGLARLGGDVVERPVEVVMHRQEVAREAGRAVKLGVAAIAVGSLADVLHVGERAQQAVLEIRHLDSQRLGLVDL
jgi:hypothetical protein